MGRERGATTAAQLSSGMQGLWGQRAGSRRHLPLWPNAHRSRRPMCRALSLVLLMQFIQQLFWKRYCVPISGAEVYICAQECLGTKKTCVISFSSLPCHFPLLSQSPTCLYSAVYTVSVKKHFQTFQPQVKQY